MEHYNTLGYVITGLTLISIYMVYRVSRIVKREEKGIKKENVIIETVG